MIFLISLLTYAVSAIVLILLSVLLATTLYDAVSGNMQAVAVLLGAILVFLSTCLALLAGYWINKKLKLGRE